MRIATRSIALFVIAFVGYNMLIAWWRPSRVYYANEWAENAGRAENYLLHARRADLVVTGSSMAACLRASDLGSGAYNLSFAGDSALTSLALIERSGILPVSVAIETNVLRPLDEAFVAKQCSKVSVGLRRVLPALRTCNQPIGLLLGCVTGGTREPSSPSPELFNTLISVQAEGYRKAPGLPALRSRLEAMKQIVARLQQRGTWVLFFTMPTDSRLRDTPYSETMRIEFERAFPRDKFVWIDAPGDQYATLDGIHLLPADAKRFARYFADQVARESSKAAAR